MGSKGLTGEVEVRVTTPCATCAHRDVELGTVCVAFPEGIPDAILLGKHDHKTPYDGDHGIQYEPRKGV